MCGKGGWWLGWRTAVAMRSSYVSLSSYCLCLWVWLHVASAPDAAVLWPCVWWRALDPLPPHGCCRRHVALGRDAPRCVMQGRGLMGIVSQGWLVCTRRFDATAVRWACHDDMQMAVSAPEPAADEEGQLLRTLNGVVSF